MLDEGTGPWSAIDVHKEIARIGAQFDIDIGADATLIGLTALSRFADRGSNCWPMSSCAPRLAKADFVRVAAAAAESAHPAARHARSDCRSRRSPACCTAIRPTATRRSGSERTLAPAQVD